MNKCIFLDRDGVINVERGDYTFLLKDFNLIDGVEDALQYLKHKGYLLVIITNQAGISKGLYTIDDMKICHDFLKDKVNNCIDAIYFCPYHPEQTNSLARKPGSLLFEKAIAKFNISASESYMVGDRERDLIPARALGIKTILVGEAKPSSYADFTATSLKSALAYIR